MFPYYILYLFLGDDPICLYVIGNNLLSYCVYWSVSLTFLYFDLSKKPKILRQYKMQDDFVISVSKVAKVSSSTLNDSVPTIFATSRKKILDPNGPYKNTFQTVLRNCCLSVISKFWLLSVVVCSASAATPAYVEAWNIY